MFSLTIVIMILFAALVVWAFVAVFGRIVNRAGYSRWWLVLMIVPFLNLIMLWVFAFAEWPAAKPRAPA